MRAGPGPHLPPLADQLPGVPVDALSGLFIQVEADAVDVRGDVLLGVALGAAYEGGEGVPISWRSTSATTGSK
jgi:hypothetical protein